VSGAPGGTAYGSQRYRAPVSSLWWLKRRSYLFFVLRELSSVFVAWSVLFLLLLARAVGGGADDYGRFLDWASAPWVIALNLITLAFLVLHSVTWFNLTPAAMVVRLRGRRVPPTAIAGGAYLAWVVVSAFVAWTVLRR
jgi:fumarate reductase subunit C